jgi:hypothetical protein
MTDVILIAHCVVKIERSEVIFVHEIGKYNEGKE